MSDESTEVVEETAEVSEEALESIRKALGDDEFDAEDLARYSKDRKGWNTKHNRRNQELADKEKVAEDRLDRLEKLETESGKTAAPAAAPAHEATQEPSELQLQQQFFSRLGLDITDETVEITPKQLFRVWNDSRSTIAQTRKQFIDLLSDYGLLDVDSETGNYKSPVNLRKGLSDVRDIAVTNRDQWNDHVVDLFLSEVQEKYPDADWDKMLVTAQTSKSKDVEAEIWEQAKDQQGSFDGKVAKRTKTESKRRTAGTRVSSMAGRGAAVSGKRIKNPLGSKAGRRQLIAKSLQRPDEAV